MIELSTNSARITVGRHLLPRAANQRPLTVFLVNEGVTDPKASDDRTRSVGAAGQARRRTEIWGSCIHRHQTALAGPFETIQAALPVGL